MRSEITGKILSLKDFEAMLRLGQMYEGLVEHIGYVFWKSESVYFIRVNPEERFGQPKYREINIYDAVVRTALSLYSTQYPAISHNSVVIKIRHRLNVMPKEDLKNANPEMYRLFYGVEAEIMGNTWARDATRMNRVKIVRDAVAIPYIQGVSASEMCSKVYDGVNSTAGVLDGVGVINLPKWFSYGQTAITIAKDIVDGEYFDAAGHVLLAVCPYSFVLDIGKAMYDTDYMQEGMRRNFSQHFDYYKHLYCIAVKEEDPAAIEKYSKEMKHYERLVEKCCKNLNINIENYGN